MTTTWRIIELIILYVGIPIVLVYSEDIFPLIPTLLLIVGAVIVALRMQGWQYRDLWILGPATEWQRMFLTFLFFAPLTAGVAYLTVPEFWFSFPQENFTIWVMVMFLYPLLSALPQEIMYRTYFFWRFNDLFQNNRTILVLVSSFLFAFGHIMFMHWFTLLATFLGGILFTYRYVRTRSVLMATVEHGLYGNLLFTVGFGQFIFSGAV